MKKTDKKVVIMSIFLLSVGLTSGYGVAFGIYQPRTSKLESDLFQTQTELSDLQAQVAALNSSLIDTQSMLSGWKDGDHVVASDSWFFISVAPYQNDTHECYYHSELACMGEMVNTQLFYLIEEVDGFFYTQGVGVTGNNGFLDLYLPLNKTYEINIVIKGLKGNVTITTFPESPTCITTLKVE